MRYDFEKLEKMTGEIICKTIYLQVEASKIISHYYLKGAPREEHIDFIHNVMTNPLSSWGFVSDVLERMLRSKDVEKKETNKLKATMRELGEIRNYFAHEIVVVNPAQQPGKFFQPDRKKIPWQKNMEGVDVEQRHSDFLVLYKQVDDKIKELLKKFNMEDIEIRT